MAGKDGGREGGFSRSSERVKGKMKDVQWMGLQGSQASGLVTVEAADFEFVG